MAVVELQGVSVGFGGPPILDHVDLQVERGERVSLIGRNGEGKTTLLRLLQGLLAPDGGRVVLQKGVTVAGLTQEVPGGLGGTVREVVEGATAVPGAGGWAPPGARTPTHQAAAVMSRLSLRPEDRFEELSVGFKRRALLARALASEPELLLLDEPTNHLDIPTIGWLEGWLQRYRETLVLVTHDRVFLRKLATRVCELDRGRLTNWACGYDTFLARREAALEAEEARQGRFLRKLEGEEAWILRGVKARRTRNEGRVRALLKMRAEQQALRARTGDVRMRIEEAERTGKLVIEAEGISHGYGPEPLIDRFSVRVMRGDRIGVIGPNGAGKTTLLRILLGETAPQKGKVRRGTHLKPVSFDQLRAQLEEDGTVLDNIAEGKEHLDIGGGRRHVIGYLKDFLFSPERARSPVRVLSGGERNRLLLARLFARPSNLLVLDEPTNDLDLETLELLEERLMEYGGTILLVSHDREFLNGVVTSSLVFEGGGRVTEYAGGYDDWLRQKPGPQERAIPEKTEAGKRLTPQNRSSDGRPRKITFREARELESLPTRIEELEAEQKRIYERMADPGFYKGEGKEVSRARARLGEVEQALEEAYARWQELESIREGGEKG